MQNDTDTQCIVCLSLDAREDVVRNLRESELPVEEQVNLQRQLDKLPDCEKGYIQVGPCNPQPPEEKQGGKRKKRKPSEYNLFVGSCRKKGKSMKQCASEWKEKKS